MSRCTECAEWTLPDLEHACPLAELAAEARASRVADEVRRAATREATTTERQRRAREALTAREVRHAA